VPGTSDIGRALRRHPLAVIIGSAAVVVAVVLVSGGKDDGPPAAAQADQPSGLDSGDLLDALRNVDIPDLGAEPSGDVPGPRYAIARIRLGKQVVMHTRPHGPKIGKLGTRTEFGSQRALWVERVNGDWFGVPVADLPNGQLAWIRDDRSRLELYETRFWILADRSKQLLELHYGDRVLDSFRVTVGRPGSPTPLGRYSVTDGLAGPGVGPYYGCCVLALTGHQPNLPPDWIGGDRIAIHGTPEPVGGARSAGCLRAADRDLVGLFARVPLGAPVIIQR
jgi:hypothetical protein